LTGLNEGSQREVFTKSPILSRLGRALSTFLSSSGWCLVPLKCSTMLPKYISVLIWPSWNAFAFSTKHRVPGRLSIPMQLHPGLEVETWCKSGWKGKSNARGWLRTLRGRCRPFIAAASEKPCHCTLSRVKNFSSEPFFPFLLNSSLGECAGTS